MSPRSTVGWVFAGCLLASASMAAAADPSKFTVEGTVVDEAGDPVAGAVVRVLGNKKTGPVTTDETGAFRFALDAARFNHATLVAADAEGDRLAYVHYGGTEPEGEVGLILKPAAEITAVVTGIDGKPIRDAEVYALTDYRVFVGGRTDDAGRWTGRVPQGPRYWAVFARKPNVGFDYLDLGYPPQDAPPHPYPAEIAFTLDGSRSLQVKTVDKEGKPIAGVAVGPWYIQLPGEAKYINLSGTSELWPKTGDDGTAVIDWLPEKFERSITIQANVEGYYTPDQIWIKADAPVDELTHTLLPQTTLSGRVTYSDGRPAAGIIVHAEGHGATHHYCRRYARTDADGRYEMTVDTELVYIVAIEDDSYAAPNITGLLIRTDDGPATGQDFVLGSGTVLRGQVTLGKDQKPVADKTITIIVEAGTIPESLKQEGDRFHRPVTLVRWIKTDARGRYEIRLGAGTYDIRGPARTERVSIDLPVENPPAETTADFQMPRPETGPFTVTVVDSDGSPVAGTLVTGEYSAFTGRRFLDAKTNAQGQFTMDRSLDPVVMYARNEERGLAGIARSATEETEATIVVGPTATATGRLFDKEGNVLAGKELDYGIRVHIGPDENSPFMDTFGGKVTTDEEGRFTLAGLVPGESYHVDIKVDESSSRRVTIVTAQDAKPIDLAELKVDPNPTPPYVPPTPESRLASAFAAKAEMPLDERIANILAEARREYMTPVLLFGRPDDAGCLDLYQAFYEEPEEPEEASDEPETEQPRTPRDLRWEFELASLSLERPEVAELAKTLGVPAGEDAPAMLVVLGKDGSSAATHTLAVADGKLDREALTAFLLQHKRPTRDAEQMLAEALAKAKAEDKRVFLIASASWCGPCRMLSRFLDPHRQELERHYVFVKLDTSRDDQAGAVRDRYKGDRDGGVPWFAILDADGNVLTTSNMPESAPEYAGENIGFPTEASCVEYFLTMLRDSAPELSEKTLASLRSDLEDED